MEKSETFKGHTYKVGDIVKRGQQTAKIESFHWKLDVGAVYLDRPIEGLRWWNLEELKLVEVKNI